jgi:putative membrane protein
MVLAFIMLQRGGAFHRFEHFLNWLADHLPLPETARIEGLHDAIQRLYSDPKAVITGCCWHLLSWAAGTAEIWIILFFVGTPVSWQEAFILESLGQALRAGAFLVPGALGVQEGGYILFGALFGLPSHVGLGLSLTKRVREVLLGIPGVIAWQLMEGRRLLNTPVSQTQLQPEE